MTDTARDVIARREQLAGSLKDMQVNLAMRGLLNGYLPPEQWEPLRLKLQNIYRRATGETLATLVVHDDGYRILAPGERDNESLEAAAKVARECFDDPQAETDPDYVPAAIREMKEAGK